MSAVCSFLKVLDGQSASTPPIWMMRQAGRYLPEYRELRTKAGSFLDLCFNPEMAMEATLQPIRRFGFDVAILFSDILVLPHAMGQTVNFTAGEGPQLKPLLDEAAINYLPQKADKKILAPIYETVRRVRTQLNPTVALLGFCGAPWTVATYMIAGHGTIDQTPARLFAYKEPKAFQKLLDRLINNSIDYLKCQIEAGADAVQIFDTWAGVLPPDEFFKWCVTPVARIVEGLRQIIPDAKIIWFPRGVSMGLIRYIDHVAVNAVSIDWTIDRKLIRAQVQNRIAIQGNLDPLALLAGGDALDHAVDQIMDDFSSTPFIFNLGHGILPQTPISHVERMLKRVRG